MRTGIIIWCCWRRTTRAMHNLMKIVSKGFVEGYYYRPRVDMELLEKYHEGIIALSACLAGEVPRYIGRGIYTRRRRSGRCEYRDIFGEGQLLPGAAGSRHSRSSRR